VAVMNESSHWQRVKALFQAAVERPEEERASFLAAAGGDDRVRQDVEGLLAADALGDDYAGQMPVLDDIDTRDFGLPSHSRIDEPLLVAGRRVGPYEIVALVGAGSMGHVYRARDTRLNRDVAVKVVSTFALDAGHMTRVAREAQTLAALNHPNVAAIYGLDELDGSQVLVLEFVDGETLSERIRQGPTTVSETVALALQVAAGLDAAHAKGIVHRDLKPSNIKIASGGVKVLDFGLAVSHADPATGIIAGSPAYMSPEQTRGERVDVRTDIWAFGSLLYELLTGKRAFNGDSMSATLTAVQQHDPDWEALPSETPAALRTLLRRCLEKDPAQRPQTMDEVRGTLFVAQRRSHAWEVGVAATVVLAALVGISTWKYA